MKTTKKISAVCFAVIVMLLVGCAKKKEKPFVPPAQKPTLNQLQHKYIDQLAANGVQVIHIGETIRIVLRNDYVFMPDSANIRESYKPVLRLVAKLMRTYIKTNVEVAGYLDNQGKTTYLEALSTRQAQQVANFLWYHKADARLMTAVGYNKLNPVAWNQQTSGRSFNRRVEISFRYTPIIRGYE